MSECSATAPVPCTWGTAPLPYAAPRRQKVQHTGGPLRRASQYGTVTVGGSAASASAGHWGTRGGTMAELTPADVDAAWNGSSVYRAIQTTLMAIYQQQVKTNALLATVADNTKAGSAGTTLINLHL